MPKLKIKDVHWKPIDDPPHGFDGLDKNGAFRQLCDSIKEKGLLVPVVVNKSKICILGHYRLWAARMVGMRYIPVEYAETLKELQ